VEVFLDLLDRVELELSQVQRHVANVHAELLSQHFLDVGDKLVAPVQVKNGDIGLT